MAKVQWSKVLGKMVVLPRRWDHVAHRLVGGLCKK